MTWQPPEPAIHLPYGKHFVEHTGKTMPFYTEEQLLAVRQQTIEECAEIAEMHDTCAPTYIAESIRKLKD